MHYQGGRVSDGLFEDRALVRCVGLAGTVYFVNPFACFHCGARARERPRYVLIVSLTSILEMAEGLDALYRNVNRSALDNGSPLRRLLLDI